MKAARARRAATWGIIACALVAATITLTLTREATIFDRAVRLTSTRTWQPLDPCENPFYFWTSSHEVLFFQNSGGRLASYRQQVYPANFDTRPAAIPGAQLPAGATPVRVSPDVKWLSWSKPARQNWDFGVISLLGQPVPTWPKRWMGFPFWSTDSTHLYTVVSHWSQHRWSLERYTANHTRPETIPLLPGTYLKTYMDFSEVGADRASLIFTSRPIFSSPLINPGLASRAYHIMEIDPVAWRIIHEWKGQSPAQFDLAYYSISPRGDQLLWHGMRLRPNSLEAFIHKCVPAYRIRPVRQDIWYTTRMDGSGREEVGVYNHSLAMTASLQLQFTPDGSHLSFIYQGGLYVLPVRR
jgi:hypothetical protein